VVLCPTGNEQADRKAVVDSIVAASASALDKLANSTKPSIKLETSTGAVKGITRVQVEVKKTRAAVAGSREYPLFPWLTTYSEGTVLEGEVGTSLGAGSQGASVGVGAAGEAARGATTTVVGSKNLAVTVSAEGGIGRAEARAGIIESSLGARVGFAFMRASSGVGVNVLGYRVEFRGHAALGLEAALQVGKKTKIRVGPVGVDLLIGRARGLRPGEKPLLLEIIEAALRDCTRHWGSGGGIPVARPLYEPIIREVSPVAQ
jgi:hypothetical protein